MSTATDTVPASGAYEPGSHPDLAPPPGTTGPIRWMKDNLFSSPLSTVLTLISVYIVYTVVTSAGSWLVLDAVISADSREACQAIDSGACWAVIVSRFNLSIYGFYPDAERWRLNLAFILLFVALGPILFDNFPARKHMMKFSMAYPVIAYFLVVGGMGLEPVSTHLFGGVMLTLVIGLTGITCSLPIGILLALGRYSKLPVMRMVCTMFIEFIRGVPLIALLFGTDFILWR